MQTILTISFVALFCLVRAIMDFRRKSYAWSAASFIGFVALIALPIPTHAVIIDLPSSK